MAVVPVVLTVVLGAILLGLDILYRQRIRKTSSQWYRQQKLVLKELVLRVNRWYRRTRYEVQQEEIHEEPAEDLSGEVVGKVAEDLDEDIANFESATEGLESEESESEDDEDETDESDEEPAELGAEGGPIVLVDKLQSGDSAQLQEIIGLAYHRRSNCHYLLMRSGSKMFVSRMKSGDQHPEFSFSVAHEDGDLKLLVARNYIVVCSRTRLVSYNLKGVIMNQVDYLSLKGIADFAASGKTVYCLQRSGNVTMYSIPELENAGTGTPSVKQDLNTEALRIACDTNGRRAIFSGEVSKNRNHVDHGRVIIYDEEWSCVKCIYTNVRHNGKTSLVLISNEELILCNRGVCWTFYYVNYAKALTAEVNTAHSITDSLTAVCDTDADVFDVSWQFELERWDLAQIRTNARACAKSRNGSLAIMKDDLTNHSLWPRARTLWRVISDNGFVRVDKRKDELLVMTSSGFVSVYKSYDLQRPLECRQLPVKEFQESWADCSAYRFDTSKYGIIVVSCGRNIIICSKSGSQNVRLSGVITDIFCHGQTIYALSRNKIHILTNVIRDWKPGKYIETGNFSIHEIQECNGIILGMVHFKNIIYILVNRQSEFEICMLDFSTHEQPEMEKLFQLRGSHMEPIQMAVTANGRLVVYRRYLLSSGMDTNGAIWNGLEVYSPAARRLVRKIPLAWKEKPVDVTAGPDGGLYILATDGLRYLKPQIVK